MLHSFAEYDFTIQQYRYMVLPDAFNRFGGAGMEKNVRHKGESEGSSGHVLHKSTEATKESR